MPLFRFGASNDLVFFDRKHLPVIPSSMLVIPDKPRRKVRQSNVSALALGVLEIDFTLHNGDDRPILHSEILDVAVLEQFFSILNFFLNGEGLGSRARKILSKILHVLSTSFSTDFFLNFCQTLSYSLYIL